MADRANFPEMEKEVLLHWQNNQIFEKSLKKDAPKGDYVFYDGPPFATGLPHYGHLLQSTLKDAVPRYFTMRGYRVPRRWGWDTHGLPMESLMQKELKLKGKMDIERYGIASFNDACSTAVMRYAGEWKRYVERLGRWVEFDNAYRTMDAPYMEKVWWAFKQLWEKKLIYKGLRVSMYSPSNGTPLSNFEVAMENSYVDMEDPSVTIKFVKADEPHVYFLAWTTTPWTLPANVALAVHPAETYVRVSVEGEKGEFILAEKLLAKVFGKAAVTVSKKYTGTELQGMQYLPLFKYAPEVLTKLTEQPGTAPYRLVAMDYVSMEDGTGIVHTAPAFGEDDFQAARAHQLPVVVTLDDVGMQKPEVPLVAGMFYQDSNKAVMEELHKHGLVLKEETITHAVATFARNNTRLIYKAQPAWYVDINALKPQLLKTAEEINWHPEHFKKGRFGKGLETAPDWCISRSRYWGAALPVWSNPDGSELVVIGSVKELEEYAGKKIDAANHMNLHRPHIDDITWKNAKGEEMRRIPDVFDCWFESGSMPFASDQIIPADFIAEAQDQTRGWFYTLHVLSTALYGKPAFKDVICTGLIMAEDGKKMSKSLKNYPDPWELMEKVGADTLRMYLLGSAVINAEQLNFSEKDCATIQRTLFSLLWNCKNFYGMYAGEALPTQPKNLNGQLDQWVLARRAEVIRTMTENMDGYNVNAAVRPLFQWADDLSTWWLRRSRERMKEDGEEKNAALYLLRENLLITAQLLAPFAPFFAESLFQALKGGAESVHLTEWPTVAEQTPAEKDLLKDMATLRFIVSKVLEARTQAKINIRQALAGVTVNFADIKESEKFGNNQEFIQILKEETNLEDVEVFGGDAGYDDVLGRARDMHVELDTVLTPELLAKGARREIARRVNALRKNAGLTIADRIVLAVVAPPETPASMALQTYTQELLEETRANTLALEKMEADQAEEVEIGDVTVWIGIKKV